MDASIATTQMMLEATDLGLASTWIEMIKPDKVRKHFNVPENYEVFGLLVVGYESEDSVPAPLHSNKIEMEKNGFFWKILKRFDNKKMQWYNEKNKWKLEVI